MLELSRSFEELARVISRSVVQINVSSFAVVPDAESSSASMISRERGTGSGVVLSGDGFIVTNAHVVKGANRVTVALPSEAGPGAESPQTHLPARIVGVDQETDLALLKVERRALPHLTLANSDRVRQGQIVLAFGSPLGLANSLTMGVVSSVGRQFSEDDFMQYIQTDAPINPGNSGGPLVDANGNVIGLNTLILSRSGGSEGVGFAIPSNVIRDVFEQLRATGHVRRGMIGVSLQSINELLAEGLGLKRGRGVLVADVAPDGPADRAGLKIGDVVQTVDHVLIRNARQFELKVFRSAKGRRLRLEVWRNESTSPLDVEVAQRPEPIDKLTSMADPRLHLVPKLGILGISVTKDVAPLLPDLRQAWGVLVAAITHDPAAANADLQPGDVIYSANGVMVPNRDALNQSLDAAKSGSAMVLQIQRDGAMKFIEFRMD
jgi:serine protease Do